MEAAFALLEEGDALLVVGSSLAVYSGYRFVRAPRSATCPSASSTSASAAGDELADVRVEARAGEVLPRLAQALTRT